MDVFKTYVFCSGFPLPKVPNIERGRAEPSIPGTRNRGRIIFFLQIVDHDEFFFFFFFFAVFLFSLHFHFILTIEYTHYCLKKCLLCLSRLSPRS